MSETRQARTARYAEDSGRIGTLDKQAPDVASVLIGPRPCARPAAFRRREGARGGSRSAFACEWVEGRTLDEVETGLQPALLDALEPPPEWDCTQLAW